jgi:peptidoglycan-associated lipoprotein
MQKPSSAVSSGNIAPAIVGPDKGTKEVYVVGGMVLILAVAIGALWVYAPNLVVSSANGSNNQLTDQQVSTLLKHTSATSPLSEPIANAAAAIKAPVTTGDIVHTDIYFEVGRKGLTDEAKSILTAQADILKKDADRGLLVQGYTDQQGSADYNKKLGMKRAETVKTELMSAGVAENQIKTVSLGEEGVLCIDSSDVCRNMNRRVHLEMRKIGQEHMVIPPIATEPKATELIQSVDGSTGSNEGHTSRADNLLPSLADPSAIDPTPLTPDPASGS